MSAQVTTHNRVKWNRETKQITRGAKETKRKQEEKTETCTRRNRKSKGEKRKNFSHIHTHKKKTSTVYVNECSKVFSSIARKSDTVSRIQELHLIVVVLVLIGFARIEKRHVRIFRSIAVGRLLVVRQQLILFVHALVDLWTKKCIRSPV